MKDWKNDLDDFFRLQREKGEKEEKNRGQNESKAIEFCKSRVIPAFTELKEELEKQGRKVDIYEGIGGDASISITYKGNEDFHYEIRISKGLRPIPETRYLDMRSGKTLKSEGYFNPGTQDYSIANISRDEIIKHFLREYKDYVEYMTQP